MTLKNYSMKKVSAIRVAEAFGYEPDETPELDSPMTGNTYSIIWTERQAAEDIKCQFQLIYGEEPKIVTVTTATKYSIK